MFYKNFVDDLVIFVKGGSGGSGCVCFRKNAFVKFLKPDGGSGGSGGNIQAYVNINLFDFSLFKYQRYYSAENGKSGSSGNKLGKSGSDINLYFPLGTKIVDYVSGLVICVLIGSSFKSILVLGGSGGSGNFGQRSRSFITTGSLGEKKCVRLLLSIFGDVGLFGLSNSGKSTLTNYITLASVKTGPNYYTTIIPNIGVIKSDILGIRKYILIDIPGVVVSDVLYYFFDSVFYRYLVNVKFIYFTIDIGFDYKLGLVDILKNVFFEITKRHKNILLYNKKLFIIFNKVDLLNIKYCTYIIWFIVKNLHIENRFFLISSYTGFGLDKVVRNLQSLGLARL